MAGGAARILLALLLLNGDPNRRPERQPDADTDGDIVSYDSEPSAYLGSHAISSITLPSGSVT